MAAIPQRPVRSLLHPRMPVDAPEAEPLPLYSPRLREPDPETASIVSEAPTYRSELAPAYSPASPSPLICQSGQRTTGLPNRAYAPGFKPRGSVGDVNSHSYNVASWSTARSGPTNRHYENVARRRMQREASVSEILNTLAAVPASVLEPISPMIPEATATIGGEPSSPTSSFAAFSTPTPYSPSEDPALVGEAAAAAARSQRLYRERCIVDSKEALSGESKSWDFMAVQMRDWEERQQSRDNFRKDMDGGRRAKLARRIGIRRRSG